MAQDQPEVAIESETEAIVAYVHRLATGLARDINNNDFAAMHEKLGPDISISFDNQPEVDLAQRLELHRELKAEYPEYRVEFVPDPLVVDSRDLDKGSIRAFLNYEIHGAPPGMVVPGMNVFDFRWEKGRWIVVRSSGMRLGPFGAGVA